MLFEKMLMNDRSRKMKELKEAIKSSPKLKALAQFLLIPTNEYRPRWWVRVFVNPFIHKRGRGSIIRPSVREDLMPFNKFELGEKALVEDFATINNGVGDVYIGDNSLIGIGCSIIGPVEIGKSVMLAPKVVLSGLNHQYEDVTRPIQQQDCDTAKIVVGDETWIGANVVVVAGITIGKHAVIAGGSVVTQDIPSYSVAVGNPAKIVKRYNFEIEAWEKVSNKKYTV